MDKGYNRHLMNIINTLPLQRKRRRNYDDDDVLLVKRCISMLQGSVVKPLANEIGASEPRWERCKLRQRYHVT
jgi:hypothetical protein